ASSQRTNWKTRRSLVNTDASWPPADEAVVRVREIQAKLHQWAKHDPDRRFDDLYNLVSDPAFLLIAWRRVKVNRGARCGCHRGVNCVLGATSAGVGRCPPISGPMSFPHWCTQ